MFFERMIQLLIKEKEQFLHMTWREKGAVAQGKNPSAAASLRLNASRSTKTLAIDPLISKKQITQSGPSE